MSEQRECERLDWTSLEVHNEFAGDALLVIEGETRVPMRVELHSLPIGIAPEDYQGIELCGFRNGDANSQVMTPFKVEEHLSKLPAGRIGIVVIGATMREYIPPKES